MTRFQCTPNTGQQIWFLVVVLVLLYGIIGLGPLAGLVEVAP